MAFGGESQRVGAAIVYQQSRGWECVVGRAQSCRVGNGGFVSHEKELEIDSLGKFASVSSAQHHRRAENQTDPKQCARAQRNGPVSRFGESDTT